MRVRRRPQQTPQTPGTSRPAGSVLGTWRKVQSGVHPRFHKQAGGHPGVCSLGVPVEHSKLRTKSGEPAQSVRGHTNQGGQAPTKDKATVQTHHPEHLCLWILFAAQARRRQQFKDKTVPFHSGRMHSGRLRSPSPSLRGPPVDCRDCRTVSQHCHQRHHGGQGAGGAEGGAGERAGGGSQAIPTGGTVHCSPWVRAPCVSDPRGSFRRHTAAVPYKTAGSALPCRPDHSLSRRSCLLQGQPVSTCEHAGGPPVSTQHPPQPKDSYRCRVPSPIRRQGADTQ